MGYNPFLVEMGKRIYMRRKELCMTQEQLAERIGLTLQSISCIELGKKAIRPENLMNLCAALGTTSDYILTGVRSDKEMSQIYRSISKLSQKEFEIIENLVDYFSEKKN